MSLEVLKTALKEQLAQSDITILEENGKYLFLELEYTIEIENPNLFKLLQAKHVIAPFDDIKELCAFIQMDKQLSS